MIPLPLCPSSTSYASKRGLDEFLPLGLSVEASHE